jgi:cis-3-alkyl-4-acyloxetan-2-one decarboxylase
VRHNTIFACKVAWPTWAPCWTICDRKAPITLIVHDWGGMIGLAWALDHLDRVGRLVLMNTAGFFPPGNKTIPQRLRMLRTPNPIMDRLVLHLNLFARAALYMAPRRRLAADVKAGLIAPYNCPHNRLATLKFVQDIPLSPRDPGGALVERVSRGVGSHRPAAGAIDLGRSRFCIRPRLL